MRATDLYALLSPFSLLVDKRALSAHYRCLLLTSTHVRGAADFGIMEVACELGIDRDVYVDGETFLALLRSHRRAAEIEFRVKDALHWRCGQREGKLAIIHDVEMPELEYHPHQLFRLPPTFSHALSAGALGCGSTAVMSVGLYGVLFDHNDGGLFAYAADDQTISTASLCGPTGAPPGRYVLSPEAVTFLVDVTKCSPAHLGFDGVHVYCETPGTKVFLKQVATLSHDLPKYAAQFASQELSVKLNRDFIAAFIRDCVKMTEEHSVRLAIGVEEGALKLTFTSATCAETAYCLTEGAPDITVTPIGFNPDELMRALPYASHIVFDYAAEHRALVLRGDDEFAFVIYGWVKR
jgi:hypothetical protein